MMYKLKDYENGTKFIIFRTGTPSVVAECQRIFNFLPVEVQLEIRTAKFLQTFSASENTLCALFNRIVTSRLVSIFGKYDVHSVRHLVNKLQYTYI